MRKYTFSRWYAHNKAYQQVAKTLDVWHISMIFHDLDKPVMNMIFSSQFVKNWHRKHAKHHLESGNPDLLGAIIDWECSRFTKADAQLNARETLEKYYKDSKYYSRIKILLDSLGLLQKQNKLLRTNSE